VKRRRYRQRPFFRKLPVRFLQPPPLRSSHLPPLVKRRRYRQRPFFRKLPARFLQPLPLRSSHQPPLVKRRRYRQRPFFRKLPVRFLQPLPLRSSHLPPLVKRRRHLPLLKLPNLLLQQHRLPYPHPRKRPQKSACLLLGNHFPRRQ
jgi:hypothetical protein